MPEDVEEHARKELKRLERMNEASGEYSMAAHLPRLAARAAVVEARRGGDRHRARRAASSTRTTTASRRSRSASSSTSRCASSTPRAAARSCASSARPASARPRSASRSRARSGRKFQRVEPGRRARRGRDPRPPAHLHRRAAGQHHPGDPQGRHAQPGADARRDRQARPRHPGRSGLGAARGARPGAELDVPRQLPRRAVRPVEGAVHRHRERARHDPGPAARPHGDHRAARLHRGGEARDRAPLPRARGSSRRTASSPSRSTITRRGAAHRSRATTRARRACAASSARSARCCATSRCASPRARPTAVRIDADDVRAILGAPQFENEVAMRVSVPGVATGLAWTPVGGDILFIEATRIAGQRQADPHRPARRRDEGERAGRAEPGQVAGRSARRRPDAASRRATSTCTCRRARSRRTARARAWRCSRRWSRC